MNTVYRMLSGFFLALPFAASAETLPPPGGPYPSTVTADEAPDSRILDENLKFPPPDLVAPAPPPPSLSEELGPGFDSAGDTAPSGAGAPAGMAQPGVPAVLPDAPYAPDYSEGRYAQGTAPAGSGTASQWPSAGQGSTRYPPAASPGTAWTAPQPGAAYPGYGYGYSYPYGYTQQPGYGYGYGYPGAGYGPNTQWDERMTTPFGDMPSPWGSMPKSFFPGR